MPLPPSRRDTIGPPPRDVSDLASIVRHHGSYLRSLDPGIQGGRFGTPRPVPGGPSQIVGDGAGGGEDQETAWEWDDRATVVVTGTQVKRLSHEPLEENLVVRWHPRGRGPISMTNEGFSLDGQTITIPDPGYFSLGDTFSFQYEYLLEEDEPIDPSVIGFTTPGAWDLPTKVLSFDIPAGTASGDLLVLAVRGNVAAGGGEFIFDATCSDPRMALVQRATITNSGQVIVESVWAGIEDGSGTPIGVDVVQNPSYNAAAEGVLAAVTGVNGYGVVSVTEDPTVGTSSTPVVGGVGAIAATWIRATSFGTVNAANPSGYTNIASTGFQASSVDLSWWYDATADPDTGTSPTGTFAGEGCCVIALA